MKERERLDRLTGEVIYICDVCGCDVTECQLGMALDDNLHIGYFCSEHTPMEVPA